MRCRFTGGHALTVEYWDGDSFETAVVEGFELASGDAPDEPEHDAAGNLTYDGLYWYTYDAWNRLAKVQVAYRAAGDDPEKKHTIATIEYDGLGRRIEKAITNCGDWDATYEYYYDGHSLIETQNGSDETLKQYVWGTQYIDELIQIGLNDDPTAGDEDDVETFYYALQDANFNVLGIVKHNGDLKERYEYTPYGQRTVYKSAGADDALVMAPILESQRHVSGYAFSICDVGHQGLLFGKEWRLHHSGVPRSYPCGIGVQRRLTES